MTETLIKEINLLTSYIGTWGWHICAMIFMGFALASYSKTSLVTTGIFIGAFFISEVIALRKKQKTIKLGDDYERTG